MDVEPEQEALFYIEGPDEDGCAWICSAHAGEWCHNMGPADKVAGVLLQWMATLDALGAFQFTQDE